MFTSTHLCDCHIFVLQLAAARLSIHHCNDSGQFEAAAAQEGRQRLDICNTRRLKQLCGSSTQQTPPQADEEVGTYSATSVHQQGTHMV